MRKLLILLLILAGMVAAIWFLPLWLSLVLLVVVGTPTAWIAWKLIVLLKGITKAGEEVIPQKQICVLAANEPFQGRGFAFTFPVVCEVSQTTIDDFEGLVLKPQLRDPSEKGGAIMIVSTIPKEEMRLKASNRLDQIYTNLPEVRMGEFLPISVGSRSGECRTFEASRDGTDVCGESVYLGDKSHSIAWQVIVSRDAFAGIAGRCRELAAVIERVGDQTVAQPSQ